MKFFDTELLAVTNEREIKQVAYRNPLLATNYLLLHIFILLSEY